MKWFFLGFIIGFFSMFGVDAVFGLTDHSDTHDGWQAVPTQVDTSREMPCPDMNRGKWMGRYYYDRGYWFWMPTGENEWKGCYYYDQGCWWWMPNKDCR